MSLPQSVLDKQLASAQAKLASVEATLSGTIPKKHALWRQAQARVRQIEGRINRVTEVRKIDAERLSAKEE